MANKELVGTLNEIAGTSGLEAAGAAAAILDKLAVVSGTEPSSPDDNALWYDTANEVLKRWDGSAWQTAGSAAFVPIDMGIVTLPFTGHARSALTTTLAAVVGSWQELDSSLYPTPPSGKVLRYRTGLIFSAGNANDVYGARLEGHIGDGAQSTLISEWTKTATGVNGIRFHSPWTAFPASRTPCFIQVRNQTAARGFIDSAWIEVMFRAA